ncbi:hypothetical protein MMC13_002025 [Lambiella insularis]|nr:hypothetical protein [Lambiella insularis]
MIGGSSHILIATFMGFCILALSDNWGSPGPDDFPTRFKLQPTWNAVLSPDIKRDCETVLETWPRTGSLDTIHFHEPMMVHVGQCGIGLYVQHPSPQGTATVEEQWTKILYITTVAMDLHIGSARAGWSIDFPSGVQVCFFFNMHTIASFITSHSIEWNLNQLPMFPSQTDAEIFPRTVPLTTHEQWVLETEQRLDPELISSLGVPASDFPPFSPIPEPAWGTRPILADCENAISHLGIKAWFIERTGITLDEPMFEEDGHCTLGIYLTYPLDPNRNLRPHARVQGLSIDIKLEAVILLGQVEKQLTGGAYVDLKNGLQLCLYNTSDIDPTKVCQKMTRLSLRDCLDNRSMVTARLRAESRAIAAAAPNGPRNPRGH